MTETPDAIEAARAELLPLLATLVSLANDEGQAGQAHFFGAIRGGVEAARDTEDLAGPFMELSTSAFLGFEYSPMVALLLDRALEVAQTLSMTLSASADEVH